MKPIPVIITYLCILSLVHGNYQEEIKKADNFFKTGDFSLAAESYDEAVIEASSDAERIRAKKGLFNSLKKIKKSAKNAVKAAEAILYEEKNLSPADLYELVKFIADKADLENRKKAVEFALKIKISDEYYRSLLLEIGIDNSGSWGSEKYIEEILAMKNPAPSARGNALGHKANVTLWAQKNPQEALKLFNRTLEIKELSASDRQFFSLGKARSALMLKQYKLAEEVYLYALSLGAHPDFQNAAYNELLNLYIRTKQGEKIYPVFKRAAIDKNLRKKQRIIFQNGLKEIEKRIQSGKNKP